MLIKNMTPIEPEKSLCISVDSPSKLFAVGDKGSLLTHNSVAQRNIIISCLLRPEYWVILGIDLKRVELSPYRKFGMNVAVDLGPALDFLRFAQAVMMKRYQRLEEEGLNNFRDLPVPGQALLVMIDEAGELLSPTGAKALADWTPIVTPEGMKQLGEIQVGDVIYDNKMNETTVLNKYEPISQNHYSMKFTSESNKSEELISGEEHLWVIYTKDSDENVEGPFTKTTLELKTFMDKEKLKPKSERLKLKIKKG